MNYKKYLLQENLKDLCTRILNQIYDQVMYEEKLSAFSKLVYEIDPSDWSIHFYTIEQNTMTKELLYTISSDKSRVLINTKTDSHIIAPELYNILKYQLDRYLKIVLELKENL